MCPNLRTWIKKGECLFRQASEIMSTSTLRIIAVAFVIFDCIGTFIPGAPIAFRWIGRLAAPLFLLCMAWSMDRVRDRKRYLFCLYLCGVGMAALNLLFSFPSLFPGAGTAVSADIFTTLFASGCMILLYEYQREHPEKKRRIWGIYAAWQLGGAAVWCVLSEVFGVSTAILQLIFTLCGNIFLAEGSFLMVIMGYLFYRTKENRRVLRFFFCMICFVFFINASTGVFGRVLSFLGSDVVLVIAEVLTGLSMYGTWVTANFSLDHLLFHDYQWMMIAVLPLLLLCREQSEHPVRRRAERAYLSGALYPVSVYLLWFLGNYAL